MDFLHEPAPAAEVAAFIRSKAPLSRADFQRLPPELRCLAFCVSGINAADALQDLRDTSAKVADGELFPKVQKELAAKLGRYTDAADPQGTLIPRDPDEEKARQAQLKTRAQFILRQSGNQAFAVETHKDLTDHKHIFPYWKYLTVGDESVRETHAALEGIILPQDDEFWAAHFPPWEYNCRCQIVPVTGMEYEQTAELEKDLPDHERSILTPDQADQLRDERTLVRLIGGAPVKIDMRAPIEKPHEDATVYVFDPRQLQLPVTSLRSRYDKETWKDFQTWAQGCDSGTSHGSVWDWLTKSALPPPKAPRKIPAPKIAKVTPVKPKPAASAVETPAPSLAAPPPVAVHLSHDSSRPPAIDEHSLRKSLSDEEYQTRGLRIADVITSLQDGILHDGLPFQLQELESYAEGSGVTHYDHWIRAEAQRQGFTYAKDEFGRAMVIQPGEPIPPEARVSPHHVTPPPRPPTADEVHSTILNLHQEHLAKVAAIDASHPVWRYLNPVRTREIAAEQARYLSAARAATEVPAAQRGTIKIIADAKSKTKATEVSALLEKHLHKDILPGSAATFKTVTSRASFHGGSDTVRLRDSAGEEICAHEMGHWIEKHRPEVLAKTLAYRASRTKPGEKPQKLAKLMPGNGLGPDEMTLADEWKPPYIGKLCRNKAGQDFASEVLSKGLEQYLFDPGKMAAEDPSYFKFIFNLTNHL